jgi:hypothetical protein
MLLSTDVRQSSNGDRAILQGLGRRTSLPRWGRGLARYSEGLAYPSLPVSSGGPHEPDRKPFPNCPCQKPGTACSDSAYQSLLIAFIPVMCPGITALLTAIRSSLQVEPNSKRRSSPSTDPGQPTYPDSVGHPPDMIFADYLPLRAGTSASLPPLMSSISIRRSYDGLAVKSPVFSEIAAHTSRVTPPKRSLPRAGPADSAAAYSR